MAKIKAVKFHTDFCEQGRIKYAAGSILPLSDEMQRCVALNFAENVSVDEKQVADPVAEKAAADQAEADRLAAEKAAAEKAAAIAALQQDIGRIEAELANATDDENPGFFAKLGGLIKGTTRTAIQASLDEKRAELAALQAPV